MPLTLEGCGWRLEDPETLSFPLDFGKGESSGVLLKRPSPHFRPLLPALAERLDPVAMTTGRGGGGSKRCCGEMEASGGGGGGFEMGMGVGFRGWDAGGGGGRGVLSL